MKKYFQLIFCASMAHMRLEFMNKVGLKLAIKSLFLAKESCQSAPNVANGLDFREKNEREFSSSFAC